MAKLGKQKQPMSVTGINPDLNWKLNNYTTMNFTRCKSAASFCAPFLIGVFVISMFAVCFPESQAVAKNIESLQSDNVSGSGTNIASGGPGLDYASWNGAMLIGPHGSLWGMRFGYLATNGEYISDLSFCEHVQHSGAYAPDGSYAQVFADEMTITWARSKSGEIVGKAEALRDGMTIIVEAYPAQDYPMRNQKWHSSIPCYFRNPCKFEIAGQDCVKGMSPAVVTTAGETVVTGGLARVRDRTETILGPEVGMDHFRLQVSPRPAASGPGLVELNAMGTNVDASRIAFLKCEHLKKGEAVYLAAQAAGKAIAPIRLTPAIVEKLISTALISYETNCLRGTGIYGKAVKPMANETLWMKMYNPFERMTWLTLGRYWQADGRYNVWGWDENCGAIIASQFDAEDASKNLWLAAGDERLGPLAAWTVFARNRDLSLLAKVYPIYRKLYPPTDSKLVRGGGDWNGNVGKGMDDTPMREHTLKLGEMYSLDMSCMKAWSLEFLERMAAELKYEDDQKNYKLTHGKLLTRINETFWNEKEGIYRNRYLSGQWPATESPTSFYPWLAGVPTLEQSKRLLAKLKDPKKFWGEFVLVSLAKDDPQYGRQAKEAGWDGHSLYPPFCYWRGNIWAPPTYLVYEGLKRYELDEVADEYAQKCVNLWWKNWESHGWSPENNNPETGDRSEMASAHYIWSNLLPLIGIQEVIDVEPWGDLDSLRFGTLTGQPSTISNWRWKGHRFDVSIGNGVTTLHRDGKLVIQIAGGPCVVRHFNTSNGGCSFTLKSRDKLQVELATTGAPQGIGRVEVSAGRHQVFANLTGIIQVTNIE